jgi:ribonuclease P protein subunit RPR2
MPQRKIQEQKKSTRRSRRYQKKPDKTLKIAREHMDRLFDQAKKMSKENLSLANRYITLARKIAMKFKLRIPSGQKRLFCPHCYRFALPGKTVRVRIHESRVIYSCQLCKRFWRKPLKTGRKHQNI